MTRRKCYLELALSTGPRQQLRVCALGRLDLALCDVYGPYLALASSMLSCFGAAAVAVAVT